MSGNTSRIIIVPGIGNSGADHWQSHMQHNHPGALRMQQDDWNNFERDLWVSALEKAVLAVEGHVILVAHSLGVIAIVHWAAQQVQPGRTAAALLVAPADVETEHPDSAPLEYIEAAGWIPLPRRPLPFPSILVASVDDPYTEIKRAEELAQSWGSRFVNIGAHGHINVAAGYGPWPLGEQLLHELLLTAATHKEHNHEVH